jgi:hypothetical protein
VKARDISYADRDITSKLLEIGGRIIGLIDIIEKIREAGTAGASEQNIKAVGTHPAAAVVMLRKNRWRQSNNQKYRQIFFHNAAIYFVPSKKATQNNECRQNFFSRASVSAESLSPPHLRTASRPILKN